MSDVGVRQARPADIGPVTQVQLRAWRTWSFIPAAALEEMTGAAAEELWTGKWREAVERPPGPDHRLLVAVAEGQIAGLASHAPASEPDLPGAAELLTLLVDPSQTRRGHGSRLLNATVDHLCEDGHKTAVTWIFADNQPMLDFLSRAGWGPDGAERVLDMGPPVRMIRLATDIS